MEGGIHGGTPLCGNDAQVKEVAARTQQESGSNIAEDDLGPAGDQTGRRLLELTKRCGPAQPLVEDIRAGFAAFALDASLGGIVEEAPEPPPSDPAQDRDKALLADAAFQRPGARGRGPAAKPSDRDYIIQDAQRRKQNIDFNMNQQLKQVEREFEQQVAHICDQSEKRLRQAERQIEVEKQQNKDRALEEEKALFYPMAQRFEKDKGLVAEQACQQILRQVKNVKGSLTRGMVEAQAKEAVAAMQMPAGCVPSADEVHAALANSS